MDEMDFAARYQAAAAIAEYHASTDGLPRFEERYGVTGEVVPLVSVVIDPWADDEASQEQQEGDGNGQ